MIVLDAVFDRGEMPRYSQPFTIFASSENDRNTKIICIEAFEFVAESFRHRGIGQPVLEELYMIGLT